MRVKNALSKGFDLVSQHIKMIPLIYAVNIGLTMLLAIPFFLNLHHKIGNRVIRNDVINGFDSNWWMHIDQQHVLTTLRPGLLKGLLPLFDNLEKVLTGHFDQFGVWILVFGLAYLVLSSFLNGGVLGLYSDKKRSFSVSRFFSNAGFYFHHFFALMLTALLLFFVFYKFIQPLIFDLVARFVSHWSPDVVEGLVYAIGFLLVLFLVYFLNMVFDYAKIIIVLEKEESSWMCIWLSAKFIFSNFGKTAGLYLLLALISIAAVLVFGFVLGFSRNKFLLVFLAVLLQQLFIFVKIGIRLWFYGAQLSLYQGLHASERKMKRL